AGATSLPELAVDVSAVRAGLDDVAVGDLLGSSLCNLLILAIVDLLQRRRGTLINRVSEAHALAGGLAMLLTAIVALMLMLRPELSAAGVGVGTAVTAVAYSLGIRMVFHDQRVLREAAAVAPSRYERAALLRAVGLFGIAALAVFSAAPFAAAAAGDIAEASGLGGSFIGTTLVAASTSLPELVATIAAVRMGSRDLAVGNIFGSNVFNMAMLVVVDAFSEGPLLSRASPSHAITAIWVVIVTSVAVMGTLYRVDRRRSLIEPDAIAVILLVVAALITVYAQAV
ncbi:MAG: sodium:calcium antiporter, partial [Phycisphaerales bacterium]